MYWLFEKKIFSYGHNDGDEITDEYRLLIDYSTSQIEIQKTKDEYQFNAYRFIESHKVLNQTENELIINYLNPESDKYKIYKDLERMSFDQFKFLESQLKFEFYTIIEKDPNPHKYYPLIKHSKFKELGFNTLSEMFEGMSDFLYCEDKDEAFEKGMLYILANNDIAGYIGDPETTNEVAEFLDSYSRPRENILNYLLAKNIDIPNELISKFEVLKFWIIFLELPMKAYQFPEFTKNKKEFLGSKFEHFNQLVNVFKQTDNELIEIINIY